MRKDSKPSVFKSARSPWQNELKEAIEKTYTDFASLRDKVL
jgi:hypothetical protein